MHDPKAVEIVCHRGASNRAPENTFAAAREAVAGGADYVELDVNRSADGVHYVFHGPRLEGTTNGQGLFHLHDSTYLDGLDAGSWFGERFAGEPIPRLDAMLEVLQGKCKIFLDVKRANLPELIALVERTGFAEDCFFWFGRDEDAVEFRSLSASLALKINVCNGEDVHRAKREFNASIVEAPPRHLSKGLIAACRENNMRLMVNYMGSDRAVFEELARWPIDMINLDYMQIWQAAAASATPDQAEVQANEFAASTPLAGAPTRRVVMFLLDGCRPDALAQAQTPNIDRLAARSSFTWSARSIMPSITLPCHTSLFYSLPSEVHGVVENRWQRPPAPAQSLAEVVNESGLDFAMFFTWEELRDLSAPGTAAALVQHRLSREGLEAVARSAAAHIAEKKPALSYVYLEATDARGHQYGWMSPEYLEAVTFSDGLLGQVIAALEAGEDDGETVFVVLADHGGHDFGHGTDCPEDMTIPILFVGPGVRRDYPIQRTVSLLDVGPTILALLGLEIPENWQGKPIAEIMDSEIEHTEIEQI